MFLSCETKLVAVGSPLGYSIVGCECRRAGGQLKTWATTIKADLEPLSKPRVFGHAQWRKDWVKVSSELAKDRRAWSASVRDVVNAIGDAGSTRPE